MIGTGYTDRYLTDDETRDDRARRRSPRSRSTASACCSSSRTARARCRCRRCSRCSASCSAAGVAALDYLVALGTHQPMDDAALSQLVGVPVVGGPRRRRRASSTTSGTTRRRSRTIGTIPAAEIAELSGGRLAQDVPVSLNRLIFDYDQLVICGPGVPARGGRLLGRQQVLLPRHRRAPRSSTSRTGSARSSPTTR